jgi:hypothetical protein
VAAAEYPKVSFCIARPARLKTDLLNTPTGTTGAEDPIGAAMRILAGAATGARPREVCYLK